MIKNQDANKTVFEQQALQLLNEFSLIVNEKWFSLNLTGCNLIKSLSNHFADLSNKEENKFYDEKLNVWKINSATFGFMSECNEIFDKLNELLESFSFYLNRLTKINSNLISLIGPDLEIFRIINFTSLKNDLADLCQCFHREFSFKSILIKKYLFESRFDHDLKIAILSSWMHQPYLDELKLFKVNQVLNNYTNLNKK